MHYRSHMYLATRDVRYVKGATTTKNGQAQGRVSILIMFFTYLYFFIFLYY